MRPRQLPPQDAAARLRQLGYPLYAVPFGQSRGLGQVKDIAVKDLLVNQTVFVKNELAISGQIRVDGFVNRDIPVRVLFETAPGKMEEVGREMIRAGSGSQLLPVKFSYVPQEQGECKITLEAVPQPGELVATNNELSTFVNVLKGGLNVLYLEGDMRVEQAFLRRALDASPDIKVDFVRIDPRRPETRPGDLADRFKPGKYDVYILGDLDATAFRGEELKDLAEAVNRGAGLMMLGGFHTFGAGGYFATPLDKVLPVVMDPVERQRPDDATQRTDLHLPAPVQMRPTPELGLLHFALHAGRHAQGERGPVEAAAAARRSLSLPPREGRGLRAGRRRQGDAAVGPKRRRTACWPSPATRPGGGRSADSARCTSASGGRSSSGWPAATKHPKGTCG